MFRTVSLIISLLGCFVTNEFNYLNNKENMLKKNVTVDDVELDFNNGVIFAVLKEECNYNKITYSSEDFPLISCKSVEEVIEGFEQNFDNDPYNDKPTINNEKFNRILKITLTNRTKEDTMDAVGYLRTLSFVESVDPDYFLPIISMGFSKEIEEKSCSEVNNGRSVNYDQWSLRSINQIEDINNFLRDYPGIIIDENSPDYVGVIDTGVEYILGEDGEVISHIGLSNKVASNYSYPLEANDYHNALIDNYDHGTAVAGIIAAKKINNKGINGVSTQSQIVSLKCQLTEYHHEDEVDNEQLCTSISNLLEYIVSSELFNFPEIKIVNCSFGTTVDNDILRTAIEGKDNILFVCGAGNSELNLDSGTQKIYPACYDFDNILTVGAIDEEDHMWHSDETGVVLGTNYGAVSVDVFAPGKDVRSTCSSYANPENLNQYLLFSGTSFAAPHVTGLASLLNTIVYDFESEVIPEDTYCLDYSISNIKNVILSTVRKKEGLSDKCVSGGIIDVEAALRAFIEHNYDYEYYNNYQHKKWCSDCNYTIIESHDWVLSVNPIRQTTPLAVIGPFVCSKCGTTKIS